MSSRWLRLLFAVAAAWAATVALFFGTSLAARSIAAWMNPGWIPTAQLFLNCLELAAAGFVAGRLNRREPVLTVSIFAATLAIADFSAFGVPLNVPWMLRLTRDVFSDRRFFDSWLTTLGTHLLLFGCLIGGGLLSRPRPAPVSLALRG